MSAASGSLSGAYVPTEQLIQKYKLSIDERDEIETTYIKEGNDGRCLEVHVNAITEHISIYVKYESQIHPHSTIAERYACYSEDQFIFLLMNGDAGSFFPNFLPKGVSIGMGTVIKREDMTKEQLEILGKMTPLRPLHPPTNE